jgi:hypothetical protein
LIDGHRLELHLFGQLFNFYLVYMSNHDTNNPRSRTNKEHKNKRKKTKQISVPVRSGPCSSSTGWLNHSAMMLG